MITLTHHHRGIVFQGCGDCLIVLLDALSSYQAPQCSTCGSAKVVMRFDSGAQRLECPVHAHGRGLLGKALQALAQLGEGNRIVDRVRADIETALGIKRA